MDPEQTLGKPVRLHRGAPPKRLRDSRTGNGRRLHFHLPGKLAGKSADRSRQRGTGNLAGTSESLFAQNRNSNGRSKGKHERFRSVRRPRLCHPNKLPKELSRINFKLPKKDPEIHRSLFLKSKAETILRLGAQEPPGRDGRSLPSPRFPQSASPVCKPPFPYS